MMIRHLLREGTTDELSNSAQFLVSVGVLSRSSNGQISRSRSLTLSFTMTKALTEQEASR